MQTIFPTPSTNCKQFEMFNHALENKSVSQLKSSLIETNDRTLGVANQL